jgi:hypothetical protein
MSVHPVRSHAHYRKAGPVLYQQLLSSEPFAFNASIALLAIIAQRAAYGFVRKTNPAARPAAFSVHMTDQINAAVHRDDRRHGPQDDYGRFVSSIPG